MATTGAINGTLLILYVNEVAVGSCTTHSINVNAATRDATTKSSGGWEESLEGLINWSISGSGLVLYSDTYGFSALFSQAVARTPVTVKFSTEVSGDTFWHGSARITELTADAPQEESTTYTFNFKGTGVLTQATQT